MLVKLVDHKGKPRYVNPMYVKSLEPKGEAQTAVEISGWAMKLRVNMSPDSVAELLNAGMPFGMEAIIADLQAQHDAASSAG
ncbi:MAG: hypothetical protein ACF8Q5_02370 [Phycisphaerales bacterium JB040]